MIAPMFTIIRNGTVFVPNQMGRLDVLICGERILAVGDGFVDQAQALGDVRVIDTAGKDADVVLLTPNLAVDGDRARRRTGRRR